MRPACKGPLDCLSEMIYIIRPLVCGMCSGINGCSGANCPHSIILAGAADRSSSRPLVTAFIMDVISRNIQRRPPPSASLERAEYGRCDKNMFQYLLRGSYNSVICFLSFESYTYSRCGRPKLEAVENTLRLVSALMKATSLLCNHMPSQLLASPINSDFFEISL
ncbi:hypothetical protein M378DRAFT_625598 [Amanita muscaria Koide BX008]|uniref:Peroxisomal membrane protein PEX16 n=1 Tax=Amanita muscaria (strain Koide BX008) TaxID=946122 RepID=A0A0C2X853_AMAMK|nr:hypothetical protein M378DRAFT_625598 [Amanita muscaria Koide BX008]